MEEEVLPAVEAVEPTETPVEVPAEEVDAI